MKFLVDEELQQLNTVFARVDLGGQIVRGVLENYSCEDFHSLSNVFLF